MRPATRLLAALLAAAALAACGEQEKAAPKTESVAPAAAAPASVPAAAPVPAEAPRPDPDLALATAVKAALEDEKRIDAQGIDVTAKGGVVTLWGTVAESERRALAVKTARSVPGVTAVQNNLQVVSGS